MQEKAARSRLLGWIRLLRLLVWIGIALLLLTPAATWLGGFSYAGEVAKGLSLGGRFLAYAYAAPPFLFVAAGLAQLLVFCREAKDARVFAEPATRAIRRLGYALLAASAAMPLARLLLWTLIVQPPEAPQFKVITFSIVLAIAVSATFGLVCIVFAAILKEASALAEENASFL
ncbi:MAG: DUF2975 domain-containing protein [Alphaproteobacteria bacterium]|nr:DUF2975 domain-containing protein [Alphaproteobacteria bacterium]